MTCIHARIALLPTGWAKDVNVFLENQHITSVAVGDAPQGHPVDLLLPAPANLHSHAFQRAMAGLTERRGPGGSDSFWTWRDLMYRFLDHLTPEDVGAIAAYVQMEMAEAGFAAVGEFHYLHHAVGGMRYDDIAEMAGRIVEAADQSGLGLTLLPVLYQRGGCDGRPLGPGQDRFGNTPDGFAKLHEAAQTHIARLPEDAVLGVAPHSLRAVDAEGLALAQQIRGPVHIHLAEQQAEVDEVQTVLGARPVEWLLENAEVGPRWCPIHCTQMTPAETTALAQSGAVAGLCPITEANLGDGLFDGARYMGAGGQVGTGSDSNIRIDLFEELRLLEYGQRLRDQGRAILATQTLGTGRYLWQAVCTGGAQACGRQAGEITPGALADLVGIQRSHPDLASASDDALLDTLIFAPPKDAITDLWSAGRHIVRDGRHIRRDAIRARYRETTGRLRAAL
ncbi:formimidoylglutamate deiminase [Thalassococcus sp. S3]|uniref:formimidoylglutamate deiminase n=1 Tax=Thalassococcus sp. S3 TaxID=2017482 RepID=UPI0010247933|nr:formimidoylglutamate deiminase [Thalassococcus sp. S3]QBF34212.1 formimidoylglutamate deiminase [Thalassococcus sp. S3]